MNKNATVHSLNAKSGVLLCVLHNVICQLIERYVNVIRRNFKHLFYCTLEAQSPGISLIVVLCVIFVSQLFISLMNDIYVLLCLGKIK